MFCIIEHLAEIKWRANFLCNNIKANNLLQNYEFDKDKTSVVVVVDLFVL